MPSSGSYSPFQQPASYLFIDGNSMMQAIGAIAISLGFPEKPPLNWAAIRGNHRKVFYYDTIPVMQENEDHNSHASRTAAKRLELNTIERQQNHHVKSGDTVRRRKTGNSQKTVDVQLAVDALQMASRSLFSKIEIIIGDLNFRLLVVALVELGIDVHILYPPRATGGYLLAAADSTEEITQNKLINWLGPGFAAQNPMPTARHELRANHISEFNATVEWEDVEFGKYFVGPTTDSLQLTRIDRR